MNQSAVTAIACERVKLRKVLNRFVIVVVGSSRQNPDLQIEK